MLVVAAILGVALIAAILVDVFETIVLPRRVTRRLRLTRLLYRATWRPWRNVARMVGTKADKRRDAFLGVYGPLSLLLLLGMWTLGLILGFALLQWANGTALRAPERSPGFGIDVYFSASTLFTLGLGDVAPRAGLARPLAMIEAGGGFGVLALVIGYLPALYQSFSHREVAVSLLDARAGSPPSATTLLIRYSGENMHGELAAYLREWETWAAELMESHLSYPMLAYFRSQHDNQSWLAALTTILDTCALVRAGFPHKPIHTADLTFAMGRHAVVDIAQIFGAAPHAPNPERLGTADLARLRTALAAAGLEMVAPAIMTDKLTRMRALYEPYVNALSDLLDLPLPPWISPEYVTENWRSTAWDPSGATPF